MIYFVLTRDDKLVGVTYDDPYQFNLPDVSIHEMDGTIPDLNEYSWNFESDSWVKVGKVLSRLEFLARFSTAERIAIRASTNSIVIDFMDMLDKANYIDTSRTDTQMGVNYLSSIGLILANRVATILA